MDDDVKNCPIWNAFYRTRDAQEDFLRADALKRSGQWYKSYERFGIENLQKAAAALGYDLVKREKQEAA